MKLLIVEDEEDLAMGLKRGLRKNGYEVEWIGEGRDGLALALAEDYGCVLLDLNLPGLDGLDLLRRLRAEKPQQKVLILSARGSVGDKVKGLDLGADDYLVKPFHFEELLARIRNLTGRRFIRQDVVVCRGSLRHRQPSGLCAGSAAEADGQGNADFGNAGAARRQAAERGNDYQPGVGRGRRPVLQRV